MQLHSSRNEGGEKQLKGTNTTLDSLAVQVDGNQWRFDNYLFLTLDVDCRGLVKNNKDNDNTTDDGKDRQYSKLPAVITPGER